MNCKVVAWLLVAGLVLGSCTTATCSSRLLLDARPCRKELIHETAADHAEADAEVRRVAGGGNSGGETAASRRSLGQRAPSPPSPLPNKRLATKMPAPPPPLA